MRFVINRLEARLQPNVGFTSRRALVTVTRLARPITPPKVNRFGWILEHFEYIIGGWPWQILGAIAAIATAREPVEFFCQVSNARFADFLSAKFHEI